MDSFGNRTDIEPIVEQSLCGLLSDRYLTDEQAKYLVIQARNHPIIKEFLVGRLMPHVVSRILSHNMLKAEQIMYGNCGSTFY
jgi:hypothetical protein